MSEIRKLNELLEEVQGRRLSNVSPEQARERLERAEEGCRRAGLLSQSTSSDTRDGSDGASVVGFGS